MKPFNHRRRSKPPRRPRGAPPTPIAPPSAPTGRSIFCVSMLPYPSGVLHMGHVRNYTINDMMYRHLRMRGLQRADADGLGRVRPARRERRDEERRRRPPSGRARTSRTMKRQCRRWAGRSTGRASSPRAIPSYYKWNQWFFLKMLEKGIAYRKTQRRQLGPGRPDGARQRAGDRRPRLALRRAGREARDPDVLPKITDYAEELLAYLDKMPGWPERVKTMQANWIGKSVGVRFAFPHDIRDDAAASSIGDGRMYVFTTRADTIMGVTFCAVAPEHPLAQHAGEDAIRRSPRSSTNAGAARSSRPTSRRWKRRACRRASTSRIRSPTSRSRCGSATTC